MHDIVDFLKDATVRGASAGIMGCYVARDGAIYSRTMMMQAGIEWPSKVGFTVMADALDGALSRMKNKGEVSLNIEKDFIVVKCGRLKSTIRRVHEEAPPLPNFENVNWQAAPRGLTSAVAAALPFMGDRIWQQSVRLFQDRVTAFSGAAGIDITLPGLGLERPYLLSEQVAKFMAQQGDPDEIGPERNTICFRWNDGRWVRASLLDDTMPEDIITRIFDHAGTETPVAITKEWHEALDDAVALSDATVRLTAEGFQSVKENVTSDVALAIDVPTDHSSYWKGEVLLAVLKVATAWNPLAYPAPAYFTGPNVRGVIAGYRS